jgi:hypothetical protein
MNPLAADLSARALVADGPGEAHLAGSGWLEPLFPELRELRIFYGIKFSMCLAHLNQHQ